MISLACAAIASQGLEFNAIGFGVMLLDRGQQADQPIPGKWICKVCSMIYDPAEGDPDSGIAPGTPFEAIPDDWHCPICGARKASFVPHREAELKTA